MPDTAPEVARSYAFCYFGLLRCPDRLDEIVKILPEARQQELAVYIQRARSLTRDDIVSRLRTLRQQVSPAQKPEKVRWERLSPALRRCLSACPKEDYGRQDPQK